MREDETKRPPVAGSEVPKDPVRKEGVGSREGRTEEAVRKDQASVEALMQEGPPPDPGIEEDYGKRAGEIPSQEPGNPRRGQDDRPT